MSRSVVVVFFIVPSRSSQRGSDQKADICPVDSFGREESLGTKRNIMGRFGRVNLETG
jgi:hypothetical protein